MIKGLTSNRIVRYLLGGGTGAVINLVLLALFVEVFHVWYLSSAVLAYTFSIIASFLIQKFFVFKNNDQHREKKQVAYFFTISLINIVLNGFLMWGLVDLIGIFYLLAQIISSILIAIESYFLYKHAIFNNVNQAALHESEAT